MERPYQAIVEESRVQTRRTSKQALDSVVSQGPLFFIYMYLNGAKNGDFSEAI